MPCVYRTPIPTAFFSSCGPGKRSTSTTNRDSRSMTAEARTSRSARRVNSSTRWSVRASTSAAAPRRRRRTHRGPSWGWCARRAARARSPVNVRSRRRRRPSRRARCRSCVRLEVLDDVGPGLVSAGRAEVDDLAPELVEALGTVLVRAVVDQEVAAVQVLVVRQDQPLVERVLAPAPKCAGSTRPCRATRTGCPTARSTGRRGRTGERARALPRSRRAAGPSARRSRGCCPSLCASRRTHGRAEGRRSGSRRGCCPCRGRRSSSRTSFCRRAGSCFSPSSRSRRPTSSAGSTVMFVPAPVRTVSAGVVFIGLDSVCTRPPTLTQVPSKVAPCRRRRARTATATDGLSTTTRDRPSPARPVHRARPPAAARAGPRRTARRRHVPAHDAAESACRGKVATRRPWQARGCTCVPSDARTTRTETGDEQRQAGREVPTRRNSPLRQGHPQDVPAGQRECPRQDSNLQPTD